MYTQGLTLRNNFWNPQISIRIGTQSANITKKLLSMCLFSEYEYHLFIFNSSRFSNTVCCNISAVRGYRQFLMEFWLEINTYIPVLSKLISLCIGFKIDSISACLMNGAGNWFLQFLISTILLLNDDSSIWHTNYYTRSNPSADLVLFRSKNVHTPITEEPFLFIFQELRA